MMSCSHPINDSRLYSLACSSKSMISRFHSISDFPPSKRVVCCDILAY